MAVPLIISFSPKHLINTQIVEVKKGLLNFIMGNKEYLT